MGCFVEERVGVDFAEFTLGFGESGMECRSEVSLRAGVERGVNRFQ